MEDIQQVVRVIVAGCKQGGIEVPEVLAAFIARTVIEDSAVRFSTNKEILPEDADEVRGAIVCMCMYYSIYCSRICIALGAIFLMLST
jgi:hypothetical protein